ncbi:MAG: hypothetical protein KF745_13225 [Phycisphaeraceae bacterium]|nr:hypothetical protein [Phycisphaeraceae bacterium]
MTVTSQLLELFRVDKQVRGLRSRLDVAESFLTQQTSLLDGMSTRAAAIESQAKHLRAEAANAEGEAKRLDAKIAGLREQMNSAKTAKEYNAFLTELGTFKDQKDVHESDALAAMSRIEEQDKELATIRTQITERQAIAAQAKTDRDAKEAEIRERLAELTKQRATLAKAIPAEALVAFEQLVKSRGDEAMASVEVIDRRAYEYSCAACFMTLPVETVSSIVSGKLTRCVSCHCILYTEEEIVRPKSAAKG